MSEWYFAKKGGDREGPVSIDALKVMVSKNELSRKDRVWHQGMEDWLAAESVPELSSEFQDNGPPELPSEDEPVLQRTANEIVKLIDWGGWDLGGRIIFVSACVALFSMLMKWVDVGFASANGFSQGTVLFLGVYVYPLLKLFRKQPIHQNWGIACGGIGIVLSIMYIGSRSFEIFDRSVNVAAAGPYLFILTCIALIVGVLQYSNPDG